MFASKSYAPLVVLLPPLMAAAGYGPDVDTTAATATMKSLNVMFLCNVHTASSAACDAAYGRRGKIFSGPCSDSAARRASPQRRIRDLTTFFFETFILVVAI